MDDCIGSIVIKTEVNSDNGKEEEKNDLTKLKFPSLSPIRIKPEVMNIKCPKCPLLFPNEDSLNIHWKTHVCQFCDFEIRHVSETNEHFLNTHVDYGADTFTCLICSESFDKRHKLVQHVCDRHTRVFKHQCSYCDKNFRDSRHVIVHERFHTGERPYGCSKCDKKFVDKRTLNNHVATHGGEKFECPVCKKTFHRKAKLNIHVKIHDANSPYRCDICDKVLSSTYSLGVHMKIHNSFQCDICDEKFERRTAWQYHMLAHKGVSSYDCPVCGKAFAARCELNKHVVSHTGEKPLQCDICSKAFATKKTLGIHLRIHTEAPKHKCEDCGKCFYSRTQLNTHRFVHTQKSDFQCEVCHKYMSSRTRLEIHSRIHQVIKPFKCELCARTFAQKSQLKEHMVTHSSVKAVECGLCGLTFKHKRSLRKHAAKKHPHHSVPDHRDQQNRSMEDDQRSEPNISPESQTLPSSPVRLDLNNEKRRIKQKVFFDEQVVPKRAKVLKSKAESRIVKQTAKKKMKSATKLARNKMKGGISIASKKSKKMKDVEPIVRTSNEKPTSSNIKLSKNSTKVAVQIAKKSKITKSKDKQPKINSFFAKKSPSPKKSPKGKEKQPVKCDFCAHQFDTVTALKTHVRTHHGSSRYQCPKCDKLFHYQASFEKHIKTHSNSEPPEPNPVVPCDIDHNCGFCEATFSNAGDLKSHLTFHTESILRESAEMHRQFHDRNLFDVLAQIKQEPVLDVDQSTAQTGYSSYVTGNETTASAIHSNNADEVMNSVDAEQIDTVNSSSTQPKQKRKSKSKPKHDEPATNASYTENLELNNDTVKKPMKRPRKESKQNTKHSISGIDSNNSQINTMNQHVLAAGQTECSGITGDPPQHVGGQIVTIDIGQIKQEPMTDILGYIVEGNMLVPVISETVSLAETNSTHSAEHAQTGGNEIFAPHIGASLDEGQFVQASCVNDVMSPLSISNPNIPDSFSNDEEGPMTVISESGLKKPKAKSSVKLKKSALIKSSFKKKPISSWSHKCNICQKEFPCPSKLKQHSKYHDSTKNHKMKISMKFTSPKKSKLKSELSPVGEKVTAAVTDGNVNTKSIFERHISSPTKSFPCAICSKPFLSKAGLGRHRKIHDSPSLHVTENLSETISPTLENSIENSATTVENSNSSKVISKDSTSDQNKPSPTKSFPCEICSKLFVSKAGLGRHRKIHESHLVSVTDKRTKTVISNVEKSIGSSAITMENSSSSKLMNIVDDQIKLSPTKSFPCEICSKLFISKAGLGRHRKIHELPAFSVTDKVTKTVSSTVENSMGSSAITVENSGSQNFTDMDSPAEQNKSSPTKSFPCEICSKLFISKAGLGRHRKIHESTSFSVKEEVTETISSTVDTPIGRFPTTVKNSGNPKLMDMDLPSEQNQLSPNESFPCKICSKQFLSKAGLGQHRKIHESHTLPVSDKLSGIISPKMENSIESSTAPVENSSCPNTVETSMGNPVTLSLDDFNPFHCIICGQRFPTEQSLTQHAKTHVKKTKFSKVMILTEERD